jgi:hypothetical protein
MLFAITIRAQEQPVTFPAREMTIRQALSAMEKQTGKFFGFSTQLDLSRTVRVEQPTMTVEDAIEQILGPDFAIEQQGNYILIYDRKLEDRGYLGGRLVDALSGKPIVGARIEISDTLRLRSDHSGAFQSEKVPKGTYIVRFTARNYRTAYREMQTTEKAGSQTFVSMRPLEQDPSPVELLSEPLLDVARPEATFAEYVNRWNERHPVRTPATLSGYRPFTRSECNYRIQWPVLAVKTNLLYWAVRAPNVGAEVRLGDQWSVNLSVSGWPWELKDEKSLRLGLVQPEVRYWPCGTFEKYFIGFHGTWLHYRAVDLGWIPPSKDRYLRGNAYGAGLTVGYHKPIGKRWGVEFVVGVGSLKLRSDLYDGMQPEGTPDVEKYYYRGPTRIDVSFLYLIR